LVSIGEHAVQVALKNVKADTVEVYLQQGSYITVNIERESISSASTGFESGIGIRVVKNRATGFACSNILNKRVIQSTIKAAVSLANHSPAEKFNSIPDNVPTNTPKITGLYDPEIENFTVEMALGKTIELLDEIKEEKKAFCESGGFAASSGQRVVVSSTGTLKDELSSSFSWSLYGFGRDGQLQGPYTSEFGMCITEKEIDVIKTTREFKKQVLSDIGKSKIGNDRVDFVLNHDLLHALVSYPVLFSSNADNIVKNFSKFRNKLNTRVTSEQLTINDDGTIPGNIASSEFDREGWPLSKRTILDKGVLNEFLTDYRSAQILNIEPTGNASGYYRTLPGISCHNLIYDTSEGIPKEKILADIKNGFLIKSYSGEPDLISGDFSLAVRGKLIKNGEVIDGTIREIITGNIYDVMNQIEDISREKKVIPASETPEITKIKGIKMTHSAT